MERVETEEQYGNKGREGEESYQLKVIWGGGVPFLDLCPNHFHRDFSIFIQSDETIR
jgi:hypothetical protein